MTQDQLLMMVAGGGLTLLFLGLLGYIVFLRAQLMGFQDSSERLLNLTSERIERYDQILDMQHACTQGMINSSNLMRALLSNLENPSCDPDDMSNMFPLKKDS